jgi:hypothetical protein
MEHLMKRTMITAVASLSLLLGGCATTIRSDVTTFHQWPAEIADKSYAFEAPAPQDNTLELQNYQNLVRGQLTRLGFHEAPQAPALKVAVRFTTTDVPTQVVYPSYAPFYPYGALRLRRLPPPLLGRRLVQPFYDPFWGPMPRYEVEEEHRYHRQLQIAISSAGRQQAPVRRHGAQCEQDHVDPGGDAGAGAERVRRFPGPNGGARVVELKQQNG